MRVLPRKRIDIRYGDLIDGLRLCARPYRPCSAILAENAFGTTGGINLACLSVRTAFDLLLQEIEPQLGDQVIMSGVTIPHMVEIAGANGVNVVPVDVDLRTMAPRWDQVRRAIGPRTRAIVAAHLFGSRFDATPGIELARQHDLLFVEDAAQAFDYSPWRGHSDADLSLFSFGPLKTATVLGGAMAVIRNVTLGSRMRARNAAYERCSNLSYALRLMKYLGVVSLANPTLFGAAVRGCGLFGLDFDRAINGLTRSFQGTDLLRSIRRRPASAQLELLALRLCATRDDASVTARVRAATQVARSLPATMSHLGGEAEAHSHWLLPVVTKRPDVLIRYLRDSGFDATRGGTSLGPLPGCGHDVLQAFGQVVYLPTDGLTDADANLLVSVLSGFEAQGQ